MWACLTSRCSGTATVGRSSREDRLAEYETREAAESAARARADGGTIDVREDDPSGLDPAAAEPERTVTDDATGVDARERARSTQSGL